MAKGEFRIGALVIALCDNEHVRLPHHPRVRAGDCGEIVAGPTLRPFLSMDNVVLWWEVLWANGTHTGAVQSALMVIGGKDQETALDKAECQPAE